MRISSIILTQAILTHMVVGRSISSLRQRNQSKVTKRELLDKGDFDCEQGCSMSLGGSVCGSDGISYQNECLAWCQNVSIGSVGECEGHPSMSHQSYDNTAKVSKYQLDRFKDEKFVFIAKRKIGTFEKQSSHSSGAKQTNLEEDSENNSSVTPENTNIIYALRITNEGDEYVAKIDLKNIYDVFENENDSTPRPPLDADDSYSRNLSEDQRGIVGSDTRSKVCLRESCYPYSTIGEFDSPTQKGGCTGTVISPSAVLTAAHCFYIDGQYTDLDSFAPGRYRKSSNAYHKGDTVEPYGIWKAQFKTIFTNWITTQKLRYDIAIIHFHPTLYRGDEDGGNKNIGDLVGYVGIEATTNNSTKLQKATVTGYPYDKPNGEMWTSGKCNFVPGFDDAITYHNCDSVRGNDGSALLDLDKKVAYGVNIAGVPVGEDYPDQALFNIGVTINEDNIGLVNAVAGLY